MMMMMIIIIIVVVVVAIMEVGVILRFATLLRVSRLSWYFEAAHTNLHDLSAGVYEGWLSHLTRQPD